MRNHLFYYCRADCGREHNPLLTHFTVSAVGEQRKRDRSHRRRKRDYLRGGGGSLPDAAARTMYITVLCI